MPFDTEWDWTDPAPPQMFWFDYFAPNPWDDPTTPDTEVKPVDVTGKIIKTVDSGFEPFFPVSGGFFYISNLGDFTVSITPADEDQGDGVCGADRAASDSPTGINMDELRSLAMREGQRLDAKTDVDGMEWGVLIYRMQDGSLHVTQDYGGGSNSTVADPGYNTGSIPAGGVLVAELHTHPDVHDGVDQSHLSDIDAGVGRTTLTNAYAHDDNWLRYVWNAERDELIEFGKDDNQNAEGIKLGQCGD